MSRSSGVGEGIVALIVIYVIYRLLPLLIFVAVLSAIAQMVEAIFKAIGQFIASTIQFFVQLVNGIVQFILAIPQPVWYCLFFVLGIIFCVWWISKGWPAVRSSGKGYTDGVQKDPFVYLGIPAGCIILLVCCVLTALATSQLISFIQQHVTVR